jgi:hypothetical protein
MPLFLIYLPIIYLGLKRPGPLLHLSVAAFLVLIGRKAGFTSLEFLSYVLNGAVFAYVFAQLFQRKFSLFYVLLFSLFTELAFMVLCDPVPVYRTAYREVIATPTAFVTERLGLKQPVPAYDALQWGVLLPLSELLKHVLTTLVLAFVFWRFARREKPRLSDFAVPDWFIWALAAGLFLTIYKAAGAAGLYILMSVLIFYALGGIAIVRLFFERMGPPKFGELLFYVLQPGLLFLPVVSIGVMETWWNFRERIQNLDNSQDNDGNNENPS